MTIDQELRAALNVEPSRDFVAGVRARIANQPHPRGWRVWWFATPAAAAAVVMLAALVGSRPATIVDTPVAPLLGSRTLPLVTAPNVAAPIPQEHETVAAPVAGVRSEPEVVLDRAEAKALRRLVFGPPLNIDQPYVGTTLAAIEIAPLSIEPLPIGSEGVRQ